MALLDGIMRLIGRSSALPQTIYFGEPLSVRVANMDVAELYRTQPHLRTVVGFLARNVSQLSLQQFERKGDNDRERVRGDRLSNLLAMPNPGMTGVDLIYRLVSDMKLYDYALWWITPDLDRIIPIPPTWVAAFRGGTPWWPDVVEVHFPNSNRRMLLGDRKVADSLIEPHGPTEWGGHFLHFPGYDPEDPARGISPVQALKDILAEQIDAWTYRRQLWQRGGRLNAYLTRPATAPAWSPEARAKFARSWKDKWTGNDGTDSGGTPLLEDGMELKRIGFSAREEEWAAVSTLSMATVASVYHVSPTMVGILDNANYSNVREFKKMLYTDTLGPDLAAIEARVNAFLVPLFGKPNRYLEFNINEKLQGSFEEQAAVMSTAVGRPWMTADEARGRFNMPAIGGDAEQLVTPLNVLVGGQASPRDSGSQNRAGGPRRAQKAPQLIRASADEPLQVKSGEGREEDVRLIETQLRKFFERQKASVLSRLGAKAPNWWDEDRWNEELADTLYQLAMEVSTQIGMATAEELGFSGDVYSPEQTEDFLRAVAKSRAGAINSTTLSQIQAALDGDLEEDAEGSTPAGVFDLAAESRSHAGAVTLATTLAGFAVMEAAKQIARPNTTKTWNVQSSNPRASHAMMDGETVPVDETFSNGAMWPGDAVLGAEGVAGCMCGVTVTIP